MVTEASESRVSNQSEGQSSVIATEPDHEKQAVDVPDFGPAPDGGVRAWLVAAGAGCIFFCCLGFSNSFGTFTEYYVDHQLRGESTDAIAWIGSLSAFLQFFAGMLGGPLFDRFGAKVIRPALVTYLFAMMMLSLCKVYWQFMLVQGVLMGVAQGFAQFPVIAAVAQHFDKKQAAALGVAISGSSIGGIVIPIVLSKMLNASSLGFEWSVRVIGFVMMPLMVFGIATVKARVPPRTTSFWIPAAFKDRRLGLLILSLFFVFMGMLMPMFFLPTYAVERGMGATLAGYLPAILNAASTFGRVIPGVLADRYGRLNVYALGSLVSGIVIFCMDSAKSNAALIVYAVVFGFSSGTIISGASTALASCVEDARNIGTYTGMGLAIGGLGFLIGPPVNGAFVSHYGGFFQASMFSGAMCIFGGCIAIVTKTVTPQGLLGRV